MNIQEYREKHSQFFVMMFIFTFLGAAFLTATGHFLIGSFASTKQENILQNGPQNYLLITSFAVFGLACYLLPWVRLPFARDAVDFWFKNQSFQTRAANLLPNLFLAAIPFFIGSMVIFQAIRLDQNTYQSPIFAMGAFAFFGMSLLQSFLPLRIYFRKSFSSQSDSDPRATVS